jgi:3-isopropylmalate/(R)-2-methylmalate dehydratase small subunit
MGASLIIAPSFARIFFRNAINLGLPLISCPDLPGLSEEIELAGLSGSVEIETGDSLTVDIVLGEIFVERSGKRFSCTPISAEALEILSAGGIKALMRRKAGFFAAY